MSGVRRQRIICLTIACVCSAGALPARAQVAAGEITGLVRIRMVPPLQARPSLSPKHGQTCSESSFRMAMVSTPLRVWRLGSTSVDVELSGFTPCAARASVLRLVRRSRIDFDLSVGGIHEKVTVVGDAPIVRAETASLGTVVENEQVVQLPLNGRLFIMLAAIAPGVALPPNSVLPRINGGRPRTNEYLFDGISVLQPEPGQLAYYPIVDAIQEFKIESNSPPAEFGRFNGGVVNLTTKSGGNALHGTLFEFFRNETLNARNYFQRRTR